LTVYDNVFLYPYVDALSFDFIWANAMSSDTSNAVESRAPTRDIRSSFAPL